MGMSKPTALLTAAITALGLVSLYFGLSIKSTHTPPDPNSWDLLIFTQSWPNSVCYEWKTENASHACNMPTEKNLWTVHGIWPTKLGLKSPSFCNDSLQFNPSVINGMQNKLNQYWPGIHVFKNATNANYSLWSHEWHKHGSCAVTLPALNSQYKYFNQGIEWSEKFNMKYVLEKSGITVNSTLTVSDYWKAIKSVLKTNVWIECATRHDTKEQILSEIRICFDKALKLIDCNTTIIKLQQSVAKHYSLTNCDLKKPILYLGNVPEYIPAALQNTTSISNSTYFNSTADE